MRAFVIAGTGSGVGKTTITLALIAGLRGRGLRVRAFKAGPDFLDPAHLAAASGSACYNLDGWMMGRELCRDRFASADSDVAIVEGMMGLYDGRSGNGETGSTAELAKWLNLPVVLVADASGGARSLAATVLGFQVFDPAVRLAGVAFNRVGGPGHTQYLREAMAAALPGITVLGGCPADAAVRIAERHLGLALPPGAAPTASWAEANLDLDGCLALAAEVAPAAPEPRAPAAPRVRMGIARDAAFCFYYPDNLDLLSAAGIELTEFSPLRDESLPANLDGIYFGGGYPELHAEALSRNAGMRAAVRDFAGAGGLIYAECGGLMYLARELDGAPMAGVLPCTVEMQPRLQAIGYREVEAVGLEPGLRARGHEFHHSRMRCEVETAPAHRVARPDGTTRPEGFQIGGVVASYIHLHFVSCPELPGRMREAMLRNRRASTGPQ